jgi:hypothetical protein
LTDRSINQRTNESIIILLGQSKEIKQILNLPDSTECSGDRTVHSVAATGKLVAGSRMRRRVGETEAASAQHTAHSTQRTAQSAQHATEAMNGL